MECLRGVGDVSFAHWLLVTMDIFLVGLIALTHLQNDSRPNVTGHAYDIHLRNYRLARHPPTRTCTLYL